MTSPDITVQLNALYSLQRNGIKLGLEHTFQLLDFLGNPQKKLTFIHVAGTNGKGSTIANLKALLKGQGFSVNSFTSPHLISPRERININGSDIDDNKLLDLLTYIIENTKKMFSPRG